MAWVSHCIYACACTHRHTYTDTHRHRHRQTDRQTDTHTPTAQVGLLVCCLSNCTTFSLCVGVHLQQTTTGQLQASSIISSSAWVRQTYTNNKQLNHVLPLTDVAVIIYQGGALTSKLCPVIINAKFDFFLRAFSSLWTSLLLETCQKHIMLC